MIANQPTAAPRVTVVQPDASDPLDRFESWLAGCGLLLEVVRPYEGEEVNRHLTTDGLIVLGGKMSANDNTEHPWLDDIRELQRDALRQGRPSLGICLGGQLLAQALGGRVVRGARGVEAGVVSVTATEESADDSLFGGLAREFSVASMHGDMIEELPEGAVLLGSSRDYHHQAFRAGACAWGVQFHPEITPATYAVWAGIFQSPDPEQMQRVASGIEELAAADEVVRETSALLATRFAQVVTETLRVGVSVPG